MKVSLNWLKQYVDVKLPVAEIANRLTLAGIEVKSTNVIGADWEGIIVGQILEVTQHPNADRLHLVTLDLGTERKQWFAARLMSPWGQKSLMRRSARN